MRRIKPDGQDIFARRFGQFNRGSIADHGLHARQDVAESFDVAVNNGHGRAEFAALQMIGDPGEDVFGIHVADERPEPFPNFGFELGNQGFETFKLG